MACDESPYHTFQYRPLSQDTEQTQNSIPPTHPSTNPRHAVGPHEFESAYTRNLIGNVQATSSGHAVELVQSSSRNLTALLQSK